MAWWLIVLVCALLLFDAATDALARGIVLAVRSVLAMRKGKTLLVRGNLKLEGLLPSGLLTKKQARAFVDMVTHHAPMHADTVVQSFDWDYALNEGIHARFEANRIHQAACQCCTPDVAAALRLGDTAVRARLVQRRRKSSRLYVLGTKQTRRRTLVRIGHARMLAAACSVLGWQLEVVKEK